MLLFENMQVASVDGCINVHLQQSEKHVYGPRKLHCFVYFLSGRCEYRYANTTFFSKQNAFVYLPKGEPYHVFAPEDANAIVVNFNTTNDVAFSPFASVYPNASQIQDCMLKLCRVYLHQKVGYQAAQFSLLYKVIHLVQQNQMNPYLPTRQAAKIEPAVQYIEAHFLDAGIRISDLAAKCGISEKYFTALFSSCYQMTAKQYILRKKMEYAKKMLVITDTPISDISDQCGFSCIYYFSKLFKQMVDMTPTEYRQIQH